MTAKQAREIAEANPIAPTIIAEPAEILYEKVMSRIENLASSGFFRYESEVLLVISPSDWAEKVITRLESDGYTVHRLKGVVEVSW